ncbi:hypothetical protein EU537_09300 [Candidatus Thorarchaeota archaeon]|nr:MAG: hypothetical protein EU537_09300 [Candidatus Thorarchaeota archaeon]
MSHGKDIPEDHLFLDPKEVLSQYSVEWMSLRKSYEEIKKKLTDIQRDLSEIDSKLEEGSISEKEHIQQYRDKWLESTEIVQVKREVESRLFEIQRDIRAANKALKEQEQQKRRRERIEQEKSNAMIEWMSLKKGFELVSNERKQISDEMDRLDKKREQNEISDEIYRKGKVEQIGKLAELSRVESDIKRRLNELLDVIRK